MDAGGLYGHGRRPHRGSRSAREQRLHRLQSLPAIEELRVIGLHPASADRRPIVAYAIEKKIRVRVYYDDVQHSPVVLPLAWELQSDIVNTLTSTIQVTVPEWTDRFELLATLRACNYDVDSCIATYLAWPGMGSAPSAQQTRDMYAAGNRSAASTPRLPSSARGGFQEVTLQPTPTNQTPGHSSVPNAATGPSNYNQTPQHRPVAAQQYDRSERTRMQREQTMGFSSSHPTYTRADGIVLEMFYHKNQSTELKCMYRDGLRYYLDGSRQDWVVFPEKWLKSGLIMTVKTNCSEDDVDEAAGRRRPQNNGGMYNVAEGAHSDREGYISHPQKGRIPTYIYEEKMNVHKYYDKEQGIWVQLPLSWELQSDFVRSLMMDLQEMMPDWKDKYDMLAALRASNYDAEQCAAAYFTWGDTSPLAGARNEADAKLLEAKQRQISALEDKLKEMEEKYENTSRQLEMERKTRKEAETMSEQMEEKVSGLGAKVASLTALVTSLQQQPKSPEKKQQQQQQRPQFDGKVISTMNRSMQDLHKQHNRLRMDVANTFSALGKLLAEVVLGVSKIRQCDSGLGNELVEMRELYRREALQRKLLYNQLQELRGNIRVFCRCRFDNRAQCCLQFPSDTDVVPPGSKKPYTFDKVFSPKSTQEEVYEDTKPLVTSCIDGYNVCILAYGQTGSGKTFTMQGTRDNPGVNVRALTDLLDICQSRDTIDYTLKASMVEIYNEAIHDLLSSKLTSLDIRAQGNKIVLPGMTEMPVNSTDDIDEILRLGEKNRSVASTKMNSQSSRSHLIFMITIRGLDKVSGAVSLGTLTLCDLAGSERVSKTEATGQRLTEAANINKSLSALGQVFTALRTGQLHIPYRNSKLTHILQPSLGGDAKACLFVMTSPDSENLSETVSTLQFGSNAQQVQLGQAKKNVMRGPPPGDS